MTEMLPHINASLNGLATVLLILGFILIKRQQVTAHKWVMLSCFLVSSLFLACYLTYHYTAGHRTFSESAPAAVRTVYFVILITHIVLAVTVPPLAITAIYFGLRDRRVTHRRVARWTFPIWLYVSVTGVLVYLMLYQLYPPAG
ncbi:MAG: DUF420 domain-containing protein [Planctomycetales bacterium]|nr:DUF420 domain-containing protein [Planctomycetales bacterium]